MERNGIIKHIELHIAKEGSANAVAKKIGINGGALSTIMRGKYGADDTQMLAKIASALNYRPRNWEVVRNITNYRIIEKVFNDAKSECMWFAISNKAGSGKTETLEDIYNLDTSGTVIFIQAEEWSGRQFLLKLIEKTVGASKEKTYQTIAQTLLGVRVDGVVGAETLKVVNTANTRELFEEIREDRIRFVHEIVAARPLNKRFEKGWIRRINDIKFQG